jgi:hypothetical protein
MIATAPPSTAGDAIQAEKVSYRPSAAVLASKIRLGRS